MITLFMSYSHADEDLRDKLEKHPGHPQILRLEWRPDPGLKSGPNQWKACHEACHT